MIVDKLTKAIMGLLAVSLFMIALNPWIAPTKAYAQMTDFDLMLLFKNLKGIEIAIAGIDCSK